MYVLITGAAGGLGRAFAVDCAKRGYDLLLTDINESGLKLLEKGISNRYPVKVLTKPCDLTSDADVDALFCFAGENNVRFEMLLNIAGIDFEGGFFERSTESILNIVRINVEATLRITHKALNHRVGEKRFYVLFVSSLASFYPMPLKATYAASKSFLREFACALGQELRPRNVSVLTLCPGGLPTTPESLSGIAAQGFWGEVTTNCLEKVTHRSISRILKGYSIYIPGFVNSA
ncbi:MAG: SDR family NAD(P)-dependent oxidoreductase, partial [Clostridiales bacterium]|nr:SDR family NAD(P)-dependent oxidoreductase [Clostridiales bacterium]